jgi:hypothetical protein
MSHPIFRGGGGGGALGSCWKTVYEIDWAAQPAVDMTVNGVYNFTDLEGNAVAWTKYAGGGTEAVGTQTVPGRGLLFQPQGDTTAYDSAHSMPQLYTNLAQWPDLQQLRRVRFSWNVQTFALGGRVNPTAQTYALVSAFNYLNNPGNPVHALNVAINKNLRDIAGTAVEYYQAVSNGGGAIHIGGWPSAGNDWIYNAYRLTFDLGPTVNEFFWETGDWGDGASWRPLCWVPPLAVPNTYTVCQVWDWGQWSRWNQLLAVVDVQAGHSGTELAYANSAIEVSD